MNDAKELFRSIQLAPLNAMGGETLFRLPTRLRFRLDFLVLSVFLVLTGMSAGIMTPSAHAQVAITLGAQEVYDDNIFLENDRRRPNAVVIDDNLAEDLEDGQLSILVPENSDGDPNDDLITNVFLSMSAKLPRWKEYATTEMSGTVGGLFFADFDEQNRLTLDATLDINSASTFIPDPFYVGLKNELRSQSNSVAVAQGTATEAAETYILTGSTGIRGWEIAPRTKYGLGYTGSYHVFLGEFLLSDENSPESETEIEGADYHSHTASTSIDYEVTKTLTIGLLGNIGAQIFTSVENEDSELETEASELDRTNADVRATTRYQATKKLNFEGSAGVAFSKLSDEPEPRTVGIINEDGSVENILVERDDSDSAFTFLASANYNYLPGSVLSLGATQGFATDIDGEKILTRSAFSNINHAISDRFRLQGAVQFLQFTNEDSLSESTERFEASASVSYNLTQSTALVLGYNFADQNAEEDDLAQTLSFTEDDYQSNRVFVALNVGFLGLPL